MGQGLNRLQQHQKSHNRQQSQQEMRQVTCGGDDEQGNVDGRVACGYHFVAIRSPHLPEKLVCDEIECSYRKRCTQCSKFKGAADNLVRNAGEHKAGHSTQHEPSHDYHRRPGYAEIAPSQRTGRQGVPKQERQQQ